MSSSQSSSRPGRTSTHAPSTRPSSNTRSNGPYTRNFQQNLIDNGVYPHAYRYPGGQVPAKPVNWEDIKQRLAQPRASLSPSKFSDEDYEKFVQADADAVKEKQVSTSVIPIIEGNVGDAKCISGGVPFTNLDHLTDGTIAPGNPDIYYGARPEQLDRRVRDKLNGHIIPSTQDDLPIAPNFFVAAKGPDGSIAVASKQACYDGALGARGMNSLQNYGQNGLALTGSAATITSIYHGGQLKMYTSHPTQLEEPCSRMEYYMHQLNTWGMTGNVETFRQGATAYRNGREWAKEQRDEAIRKANESAHECGAEISSFYTRIEQISRVGETTTTSQGSRNLQNDTPNTSVDVQESDSSDELTSFTRPAKRSNRESLQLSPHQRKRQYAGASSFESQPDAELFKPSGLSQ